MLKSTSKPVKDAVRRYILDRINPVDYGIEGFSSPEEAVLWCYEIFKREKPDEIFHFGEREAFKSWIYGLAGALYLPFVYATSAHDLVQEWLQQTDDEATLYGEHESEIYAMDLVVREFFAMVKTVRNGKKVI